ncbi:hypothetical protein [Halarcobacter anaerophilus]|uniref:hypothetical protein n=1 Tax=Halarcobacter anaerophilus TaxID=877500 RepID=UPI0005CB664C|nr:hypothetical protein [Halarcobacter anaerophilus]
MSLPKSTKLALSSYLSGSRIKKILKYIYLSFSKYKLVKKDGTFDSEYLFFISHEKILREDHLKIFESVFQSYKKYSNEQCCKLEYKRVFSFSLSKLIKAKFRLYKLLEIQMEEVINSIDFTNIKNLIVFCDTTPLQNYIVEYCHKKNIRTLGLQHGFYPSPLNSKYWRRIYLASNSDIFVAWDKQTIDYMSLYSKNRKRKFIKAGPITFNIEKNNTTNTEKVKKISIYSAGIDQKEINNYLVKLTKYIKENSKINVTFICHPYFNFYNRVINSIKTGIKFEKNSKKNDNYDCHLILNSSVWLELEQKQCRFIRLDTMYYEKDDLSTILEKILDKKFNSSNLNDSNLRIPFCNSDETINKINKFLSTGETK